MTTSLYRTELTTTDPGLMHDFAVRNLMRSLFSDRTYGRCVELWKENVKRAMRQRVVPPCRQQFD